MLREADFEPTVDEINIQNFVPRFRKERQEVLGLAFERRDGYVTLLSQSDGHDFDITSSNDVLNWLSQPDDRFIFIRGGQHEIDSLLKWFGPAPFMSEEGEFLPKYGFAVKVGDLKLRVLQNCLFAYKGKRRVKTIYSLQPFYHMSDMLPEEVDSVVVKAFADRLINALYDHNIPFQNLVSPGSLFQSLLVELGLIRNSVTDIPREALRAAMNCYHTNWIAAFVLGYCSKAYDYDITSAYPSQAMSLLSCSPRVGRWIHSRTEQPEAAYGFTYSHVYIEPSVDLSPLLFRRRTIWTGTHRWSPQLNCWGEWLGYVTKEEIDLLRRTGIGKVEVLDGWWFVPEYEVYPFREAINKTLKFREAARGDKFLRNLYKLIGVASQGKLMSCYYVDGELVSSAIWNPVYATSITARNRIKVAEFCLSHLDHVLHVAVDGVLLNAKVPFRGTVGDMSLSYEGESIVASDGEYYLPGRRPGSYLPEVLSSFSDADGYPRVARGWYSLLEGVETGRFDLVGLPRSFGWSKLSDLQHAVRHFPVLPKKCKDLLDKTFVSLFRSIED